MVRSPGRAWVEPDGEGGWRMRRGRVDDGCLTEAQAHERMLALVRKHDADQTLLEQDPSARERHGVTFREVARDYLAWLADVRGAKPSTLRSELTEPGNPPPPRPRPHPRLDHGRTWRSAGTRGHDPQDQPLAAKDRRHRRLAAHGQQGAPAHSRRLQLWDAPPHLRPDREPGQVGRPPPRTRSRSSPLLQRRAD